MSRVLVTGGGPVALAVTRALLRRGHEVVLWLHARGPEELARRRASLPPRAGGEPGLVVEGGDLRDERPFERVRGEDVTHVVHAAAITRFTAKREDAQAVNVEGTGRALAFARGCPRLRCFLHLSSVHAAGLRTGAVAERPLRGERPFANEYERSKADAESAVVASELPWHVVRLATVLAADASGAPVQDNAVLVALRLLRAGLMPMIPGLRHCPVHVTTADVAGEACARLLDAAPGVHHVTTAQDLAPTLGGVLARATRRLAEAPATAALRIPEPLLVDEPTFAMLLRGVDGQCSPLVASALRCLAPFAAQLHAPKTMETARTERLLPDLLRRDPLPVLDRVMDRLAGPRPLPVEVDA